MYFLADCTAKVGNALADVLIIVCFVLVLRTIIKLDGYIGMNVILTLLEASSGGPVSTHLPASPTRYSPEEVVSAVAISLTHDMSRNCSFTLSSACPNCSLTYCCVRVAKGVKEALHSISAPELRVPTEQDLREILPKCLNFIHIDDQKRTVDFQIYRLSDFRSIVRRMYRVRITFGS